jgi:hypothetical protein
VPLILISMRRCAWRTVVASDRLGRGAGELLNRQYPRQGLNIPRFHRLLLLRQPALVRIPVQFSTRGNWRCS